MIRAQHGGAQALANNVERALVMNRGAKRINRAAP